MSSEQFRFALSDFILIEIMKLFLFLSATVVATKENKRKCESEIELTICMDECERDQVACVRKCGHDTHCVNKCSRLFSSCTEECLCLK